MHLHGIHHISCITGDARRNVDFYTRVLGLRLVAKTVNQDDPYVYHLFYADDGAHPGADLTFFEYPHAVPGRAGAGMVHRIVWRVADDDALAFWATRLADEGHEVVRAEGELTFTDPEGLGLALVVDASPDAPLVAQHPEIPDDVALRGFAGVRAYGARRDHTARLLEDVLGASATGDGTWTLAGSRSGWIAYDPPPAERGRPSAGTVHHVAWATTAAEHPSWHARLAEAGVPSTPIIDRYYFHSIYFREPSGVLFELADDAPGFTRDLPLDALGTRLVLPPWLEARRAEIESRLTPLPDPRAARRASARDRTGG